MDLNMNLDLKFSHLYDRRDKFKRYLTKARNQLANGSEIHRPVGRKLPATTRLGIIIP